MDKVALVLVLLKQLQPYLSANNLSTSVSKPRSRYTDQRQSSSMYAATTNHTTQQESSFIRRQTDKVLKEHGAAGTAAEVDALHNILNNINVQNQTKGGSPLGTRTLPPI